MQTSFHFKSAQDISLDMLDKIRSTYSSKPIKIVVEEDSSLTYSLSYEQKTILDDRLNESPADYLTSTESIERLKKQL